MGSRGRVATQLIDAAAARRRRYLDDCRSPLVGELAARWAIAAPAAIRSHLRSPSPASSTLRQRAGADRLVERRPPEARSRDLVLAPRELQTPSLRRRYRVSHPRRVDIHVGSRLLAAAVVGRICWWPCGRPAGERPAAHGCRPACLHGTACRRARSASLAPRPGRWRRSCWTLARASPRRCSATRRRRRRHRRLRQHRRADWGRGSRLSRVAGEGGAERDFTERVDGEARMCRSSAGRAAPRRLTGSHRGHRPRAGRASPRGHGRGSARGPRGGGRQPRQPAVAASSATTIVDRAAWGADERLRSDSPPTRRSGWVRATPPQKPVHASRGPALVRAIYAYHTRASAERHRLQFLSTGSGPSTRALRGTTGRRSAPTCTLQHGERRVRHGYLHGARAAEAGRRERLLVKSPFRLDPPAKPRSPAGRGQVQKGAPSRSSHRATARPTTRVPRRRALQPPAAVSALWPGGWARRHASLPQGQLISPNGDGVRDSVDLAVPSRPSRTGGWWSATPAGRVVASWSAERRRKDHLGRARRLARVRTALHASSPGERLPGHVTATLPRAGGRSAAPSSSVPTGGQARQPS